MTNFFQKNGALYTSGDLLLAILLLVFASLSSCTIPKTTSYFKQLDRDTVINLQTIPAEEMKIKNGDVLSLMVSSLNKAEDELYNLKNGATSGYIVGPEGEIYLHKLGKIVAAGLTRRQLKMKLEEDLKPYLKDPIVSINFDNHHVTLVGEVGKPQVLPMPEEKISLIDALAQSGSISQNAELSDIMVIRDSDNKKQVKHLNLEDTSIFNSPFYYLQPNDVVVLSPNEKQIQQEFKRQKKQQAFTFGLQLITTGLVIYQVFRR